MSAVISIAFWKNCSASRVFPLANAFCPRKRFRSRSLNSAKEMDEEYLRRSTHSLRFMLVMRLAGRGEPSKTMIGLIFHSSNRSTNRVTYCTYLNVHRIGHLNREGSVFTCQSIPSVLVYRHRRRRLGAVGNWCRLHKWYAENEPFWCRHAGWPISAMDGVPQFPWCSMLAYHTMSNENRWI